MATGALGIEREGASGRAGREPEAPGGGVLIHRGADGEVGSAGTRLGRARGRVNREDDRGGRWAGLVGWAEAYSPFFVFS